GLLTSSDTEDSGMKRIAVSKIAAVIFIAVSVMHLLNFIFGGVISIVGFVIPANLSLAITFILWFLAFKLFTAR
ncbi:MAG: hypothetical protein VX605_08645, partial [Pseudomonadota bacterium]|nr:hypothetical protein [Pseudomonadota bacterium]